MAFLVRQSESFAVSEWYGVDLYDWTSEWPFIYSLPLSWMLLHFFLVTITLLLCLNTSFNLSPLLPYAWVMPRIISRIGVAHGYLIWGIIHYLLLLQDYSTRLLVYLGLTCPFFLDPWVIYHYLANYFDLLLFHSSMGYALAFKINTNYWLFINLYLLIGPQNAFVCFLVNIPIKLPISIHPSHIVGVHAAADGVYLHTLVDLPWLWPFSSISF